MTLKIVLCFVVEPLQFVMQLINQTGLALDLKSQGQNDLWQALAIRDLMGSWGQQEATKCFLGYCRWTLAGVARHESWQVAAEAPPLQTTVTGSNI